MTILSDSFSRSDQSPSGNWEELDGDSDELLSITLFSIEILMIGQKEMNDHRI